MTDTAPASQAPRPVPLAAARAEGIAAALSDLEDSRWLSCPPHEEWLEDARRFLTAKADGSRGARTIFDDAAFAFRRYPVVSLGAEVFTGNPASARALEKVGFAPAGEGVAVSVQRLEPAPVWQYRLTRDAFRARPGPRKDGR